MRWPCEFKGTCSLFIILMGGWILFLGVCLRLIKSGVHSLQWFPAAYQPLKALIHYSVLSFQPKISFKDLLLERLKL